MILSIAKNSFNPSKIEVFSTLTWPHEVRLSCRFNNLVLNMENIHTARRNSIHSTHSIQLVKLIVQNILILLENCVSEGQTHTHNHGKDSFSPFLSNVFFKIFPYICLQLIQLKNFLFTSVERFNCIESTTLEGEADERIYSLWSKITNRALLANFSSLKKIQRGWTSHFASECWPDQTVYAFLRGSVNFYEPQIKTVQYVTKSKTHQGHVSCNVPNPEIVEHQDFAIRFLT